MRDSRIETMAKQIVRYSVHLEKKDRVLIDAWDESHDFVLELMKAIQVAGAYPFVNLQSNTLNRQFILGANEEQMKHWLEFEFRRMQDMDAYIVIRKKHNLNCYNGIPSDKMALYNQYYGKLHYGERIPNTKWCVLLYPNDSFAQSSGMSTEDFEDYFFNVCCLNYSRMNELAQPLNELMMKTDCIHIVAPGTDLTFSIRGTCLPAACGVFNIPCGETGMAVIPNSANGYISYNLPSFFQDTVFENIRFTLKDGVITEASSNHTERMNEILDTDENARRIGEFAMGFNPYISKPIMDTLFDEKMAMTMHFTPGNDSKYNHSGIHWDIITSHAKEYGGGEIYADGVLIRKDGFFVLDELLPLNPENLIREVRPIQ